jgi:hypothetical protein
MTLRDGSERYESSLAGWFAQFLPPPDRLRISSVGNLRQDKSGFHRMDAKRIPQGMMCHELKTATTGYFRHHHMIPLIPQLWLVSLVHGLVGPPVQLGELGARPLHCTQAGRLRLVLFWLAGLAPNWNGRPQEFSSTHDRAEGMQIRIHSKLKSLRTKGTAYTTVRVQY